MPPWSEVIKDASKLSPSGLNDWLEGHLRDLATRIGKLRRSQPHTGPRNVIFYMSGFLHKPDLQGPATAIAKDDIHGFMACIKGMDCSQGLTLVLSTPGGDVTATDTIVNYLREKFDDIEVIVPLYAMSAGTMIAMASNRIIMGRQSQLGPIDPFVGSHGTSAWAIVEQWQEFRDDLDKENRSAQSWIPIVSTWGPTLLQECRHAIIYGQKLASSWLKDYMFKGEPDAESRAQSACEYFSKRVQHHIHGRRIGRSEAREQSLVVIDLEDDDELQDAVLTAYHVATIVFERTSISKFISAGDRAWIRSVARQQVG